MGQPPFSESIGPLGPEGLARTSTEDACAALPLAVCELLMVADPSEALPRVLEAVGHGVEADAVFVLSPSGGAAGAGGVQGGVQGVVQTAAWRRDGGTSASEWGEHTAPMACAAVGEGREIHIDDTAQLPQGLDRAFWVSRGAAAVLAVPISAVPGRLFGGGMLGIERYGSPGRPWTPQQLQAMRGVAGPLALAVSLGRHLERLSAELETAVAERTYALTQSERRHRRLTEHANDMISAHDAEGRFTYVSHACRGLLGYAPEDLLGTRPREIAHPEDREDMLRAHQQVREAGAEIRYTWRGRHREGRYVWLESASRNHGPEPVVVTREIGGRLGAELRLRLVQSAVEQVNEGVVITDAQVTAPGPTIVYVNPAFTRMTGYTEDELLGRTPRLLQGPETDAAELARMRRALQRGEATEGESINYRRDGTTYLAHWSIHPLRDAAGNLSHWVSVQRDASERRADEELERRHRDELAHVTRLSMMGEMASGLAHEIVQPLTSISAYVEGLQARLERDDLAPDVLADVLGRVADQAGVASQIIRRLRSFVLKRGVVRADASVNDLVRETHSLLAGDLKRRGFEVRVDAGEGLPAVSVDAVQIQQVLVNLIRNAVEASEAATPEVGDPPRGVELVTSLDGTQGVRIDVIDRGVGLVPQHLERIFAPFHTSKDDGMGMGLTISRSIIEAHGGRLWAVANPRRGCTFSAVLPGSAASQTFGSTLK